MKQNLGLKFNFCFSIPDIDENYAYFNVSAAYRSRESDLHLNRFCAFIERLDFKGEPINLELRTQESNQKSRKDLNWYQKCLGLT